MVRYINTSSNGDRFSWNFTFLVMKEISSHGSPYFFSWFVFLLAESNTTLDPKTNQAHAVPREFEGRTKKLISRNFDFFRFQKSYPFMFNILLEDSWTLIAGHTSLIEKSAVSEGQKVADLLEIFVLQMDRLM